MIIRRSRDSYLQVLHLNNKRSILKKLSDNVNFFSHVSLNAFYV